MEHQKAKKKAPGTPAVGSTAQSQEDPTQMMHSLVTIVQQQQQQLQALQQMVLQKGDSQSAKLKEQDLLGNQKKRPLTDGQDSQGSAGKAQKISYARCANCGRHDHFKKDCRLAKRVCFSCGEPGHMQKDCPLPKSGCLGCGEPGHMQKDCPLLTGACLGCGEPGHIQKDCPLQKIACFGCGKPGHTRKDCPFHKDACFGCGELGHKIATCKKPKEVQTQGRVSSLAKKDAMIPKEVVSALISANSGDMGQQRASDSDDENTDVGSREASMEEEFKEEQGEVEKEASKEEEEEEEEEPSEEEEEPSEEEEEEEEEPSEEEPCEEDSEEEDFSDRPVPNSTVPYTVNPAPSGLSSYNRNLVKEIDAAKLFVGHLPQSVNDEKLIKLFLPFGQIYEAVVVKEKSTGLSKGFGFVKYVDAMSASQAVAQMNGYGIEGKILAVRVAGPSNKVYGGLASFSPHTSKEIDEAKIYVGKLPQSVNEDKLKQLFLPFGQIREAVVIKDQKTGLSKEYGFVRYVDAKLAAQAVAQMNRYRIEGRMLSVRVAGLACKVCGDANHFTIACPLTASAQGTSTNSRQVDSLVNLGSGLLPYANIYPVPSATVALMANPALCAVSSQIDEAKLYVRYLPQSVDNDKLIELFLPFGQICDAVVVNDKNTGLSKGYGFVKYVDAKFAAQAVARMNGYRIEGKRLVVRVAGHPASTTGIDTGPGVLQKLVHLPANPGPSTNAQGNIGPISSTSGSSRLYNARFLCHFP